VSAYIVQPQQNVVAALSCYRLSSQLFNFVPYRYSLGYEHIIWFIHAHESRTLKLIWI